MNDRIETEKLILIPGDLHALKCAIGGNRRLADYLQVTVPDHWTEFGATAFKFALEKLESGTGEEGWWTYFPVNKADNTLVGSCGYKGPPNDLGEVEIGYEITREYRNRGLATELARALVTHAFRFEQVHSILAHTQAEVNASTRVLTKCGFQKIQVIEDKEDGTMWKWERKRIK